jgi:NhaP-type Na+/H+ or K+/H+ antiporter
MASICRWIGGGCSRRRHVDRGLVVQSGVQCAPRFDLQCDQRPGDETVRTLTELTLALLLFADASTIDFSRLRHDAHLPLRLLGIGLPLTIVAGALVALFLFPAQGLGFALLLASILAPTDAALGLSIFTNPNVPMRIRQALNVESGLNDSLATPFVTLFIAEWKKPLPRIERIDEYSILTVRLAEIIFSRATL